MVESGLVGKVYFQLIVLWCVVVESGLVGNEYVLDLLLNGP